MKQLDEIKARASAATVGPWKFDADNWLEGNARYGFYLISPGAYDHDDVQKLEVRSADADFIEAARIDVPKLVAALEAVEDVLTWLDAVEEIHPSSAAPNLNLSAGGTAAAFRKVIANALEAA